MNSHKPCVENTVASVKRLAQRRKKTKKEKAEKAGKD
jgi:hypothetical protein